MVRSCEICNTFSFSYKDTLFGIDIKICFDCVQGLERLRKKAKDKKLKLQQPNFKHFEKKMSLSQAQMDKVNKELHDVTIISDETLRMRFNI